MRETIQNSLDAKNGDSSCVKVHFTLRDGSNSNAGLIDLFLRALPDHLRECGVEFQASELSSPAILLVEDFGTWGLRGAIDEDDGDDFSLFWRNIGESHKEGNRGGRWGLGKTVFPNSSRISTYFGLTVRATDDRQLLMGQIALKKHKLEGQTYLPHALYCASKPGEFEQPIENPNDIAEFKKAFGIQRVNEPGLSVAVVLPHHTISEESLIKAAILHYFFPILQGKLVVRVNEKELNSSTLKEMTSLYYPLQQLGMEETICFAQEICSLSFDSIQQVENPAAMQFPKGCLNPETLGDDHKIKSLREAYQSGKLISFKIPVSIKPKQEETLQASLKLFIKSVPSLKKGRDFYLRGGISIIEHQCFGESDKALGMLLADEGPLSRFLGDAENPAHTAWNAKSRGLESKYNEPQKTVMFIRRSLRQLFDILAKEEGVEDPSALLDIFFSEGNDEQNNRGGPDGPNPPPPPPPPPPPNPQKIRLAQVSGGFVVRAGSDLKSEDLPLLVAVEAAYFIRRGNPFRNYNRSDFEFEKEPISIRTDKDRVINIAGTGNRLSFEVKALDFEIEVSGFDQKRDLKLRLDFNSEDADNDQDV